MSLCLYVLVAMSKEEVLSKEASFKYFVLGSFASAIFLYGIAFLYGTAGATTLSRIAEQAPQLLGSNRLFLIGVAMTILGFAFKVSLFPLHSWTPDVYQGAPTPLTAFMSTAVKAATFVAFLRFFRSPAFADSSALLSVVSWIAALTMIVGNVGALMQDNFKRMLAYSSIAHSGYVFVGLVAAGFGDNYGAGATGVLFYLFSYSLMTLGSFAVIGLYEKSENTSVSIRDLKGLAGRRPWLALSLTALMLSLAGIPPTLGFFGKFYVFSVAIEQDMYWLALWGAIGSMISVYYYLRPVVMMFMSDDEPIEVLGAHAMTRLTVFGAAILVVALGIFSSPVLRAIQHAVLAQATAPVAQAEGR
jgi:NADH-quinone oxidoreductase subunit N